jgi:1-acyl-sn-glycerol-3-phosphate acyltransferase
VDDGLRLYKVPPKIELMRSVLRPFFRILFHILCQVQMVGVQNIPTNGAYLIAINHISLYEPPFILAFWPVAPEAIGAVDIWERTGQATLARLYGAIPVHRGVYDRRVIAAMVSILRSGRPLMLAPEGGRTHEPGLKRAYPGVAYVVDKVKVPVVPVGVVGSTDDFLQRALHGERPVLEMHVGRSVYLSPVIGRGELRRIALQNNADMIMAHIASLLPQDYRGVYADYQIYPAKTS